MVRSPSLGRDARVVGVTVVALLGIWCPSALAGTASVKRGVFEAFNGHDGYYEAPFDTVTYREASGERNDVTMTALDHAATIEDTVAPVVAGRGCEQVSPHEARCTVRESGAGRVVAGEGPDTVRLPTPSEATLGLSASGGPGADQLVCGAICNRLDGGRGDDVLEGGVGRDVLRGGPGDDRLVGGADIDDMFGGRGHDDLLGGPGSDFLRGDGEGAPAASDSIDGGSGNDEVIYSDRAKPLNVDLERDHGNGEAGENDRVVHVEGVIGGGNSDRLVGDGRANYLLGRSPQPWGYDRRTARAVPGQRDVLVGHGGDDQLEGAEGSDLLVGGAGDDTLAGLDGANSYRAGAGNDELDLGFYEHPPARAHCAEGDDLVKGEGLRDGVSDTCERVLVGGTDLVLYPRLVRARDGALTIAVSESYATNGCRVAVRLVLARGHAGSRLLGTGEVRLRPRQKRRIRIALTRRGRRAFVGGRRVRARVEVDGVRSCRRDRLSVTTPLGGFTSIASVPRATSRGG
jgi:hypothetical protein